MSRAQVAPPLPANRRTGAFERRVARALEACGVGGTVLVAASGGADSTAALVAVTRALGASSVMAAHFDHRLRARDEHEAEERLVRSVAARLGVDVRTGAARALRDRSEATARAARYRWLAQACRAAGAAWCVTGHTLNDQAETVLLRLARGSGALGAAGMQPAGDWPVEVMRGSRPRLVRPLLEFTRDEVEAYLSALGLDAAEDPSNASLDYARNRVRHRVLPALQEVNAGAIAHLAEFARLQRADHEALVAAAEAWLDAHPPVRPDAVTFDLDRRALRALAPAVAARVLLRATGLLGLRLESGHVRSVQSALARSGAHIDLPGGSADTIGSHLRVRRLG